MIRVDGQLRMVISIEWPGAHVQLEPLADLLAHYILAGDESEPVSLESLLVEAGWTPPVPA